MPDETPVIQAAPLPNAPGSGGWVPGKWVPYVAGLFTSIATALGPVLLMPDAGWRMYAAAFLSGTAGFASTFLGLKSAGPRAS